MALVRLTPLEDSPARLRPAIKLKWPITWPEICYRAGNLCAGDLGSLLITVQ